MASSDPFVALVCARAAVPDSLQVLGERNSGTNFVQTVMKRNLALAPTRILGWKHGFPHMLAVPNRVLVVAVVRNPFDWSRSMHAKPWHAPAEMQRLEYSEFIRAPWESVVDRRDYFGLPEGDARLGAPLQLDRHPLTGAAFANIFEMRNAKLEALAGMARRGCHFAMLPFERFRADPEGTVAALAAAFDLAPPATFSPVRRRLGAKFKPKVADRPQTPAEIDPADRAFIRSAVNRQRESLFGYDLGG